jgi:phosphate-selective porin
MEERLDLIRARATATATATAGPRLAEKIVSTGHEAEGGMPKVQTRKEKEKELAGQWSRDEIRWEKERRRKSNKAKKAKKKHGGRGEAGGTDI